MQADVSLENEPGFLFDALVVPDGHAEIRASAVDARAFEFVRDQFRHCEPIQVLGDGVELLKAAGLAPAVEPRRQASGVLVKSSAGAGAKSRIAALAKPRAYERETDPLLV